ncbi:hypothetical protein HYH03_004692 [Edaphochlamys debaryana]|uniref:BTB domain-containing protein n=1 Tax=Edaphochlamys debaryana TaxID=47281 RepID=A0A835Y6T6_9CHLO|nr:hypothetical protein HYH03_004692 [Edaphochlamys debaryana]|eukprot:KAG2497101.1 hypothetical protein HYH03_004692 [Edaphochlamys debaryana]
MLNEEVTLMCKEGASVKAHVATLVAASPVLRESLGLALPKEGELKVEQDDAGAWAAALRLLQPEAHPEAPLLGWENVESVLKLADKYDMNVLRLVCVGFLGCRQHELSLGEPLPSPKNLLAAASLVDQYCSRQPELQPLTEGVTGTAKRALSASSLETALTAARKLRKVAAEPAYEESVSLRVQVGGPLRG